MESKNRNLWIIVALVAVLLCCCTLADAVTLWRFIDAAPLDLGQSDTSEGERIERNFQVGGAPLLEIDNFAGSVTVVAGEQGEIAVVAVKRTSFGTRQDRIRVTMTERDGGLVIETRKPSMLSSASVRLEIIAPADTRLDLHTGAGSIEVRGLSDDVRVDTGTGRVSLTDVGGKIDVHSGAGDIEVQGAQGTMTLDTGTGSVTLRGVSGQIDAHSGAGSIEIRDSQGQDVRLDTGTGSIDYDGQLQGDCRFESGAGSITLRLPADLDMEVEMDTGAGSIEVAYDVDGRVTKREVEGTIGNGADGSIYAHTGTGSIDLVRR